MKYLFEHDLWKISSPTVILTVIVQCSFPGALALVNWNFGPGCISGQKHQVLMKHPWGECSKLLVDWVLGPMAGKCGKSCAVVMIPVRPGTLTTATRVTQHTPTFGPRTQSTGNRGTTPGGCQQTPNASTTEATWARVKFAGAMAPEDDHNTDSLVWRLGMVSKPRRCHEHPGRTDMLMKPTRVTHQALLSDQGLNIVVVFAPWPLQAEALQQLASVGKHQGSGV